MEAFAERRRNPASGGLRRSRSVRASLRMIGNRWKGHKPNGEVRLNQSLSDPDEPKNPEIFTQIIKNDELYVNYNWDAEYKDTEELIYTELEVKKLIKTPVMSRKNTEDKHNNDIKTLLRSSSDKLNRLDKKDKFSDIFRGKLKEPATLDDAVFQIPAAVPPKAAAILHIPASCPTDLGEFDLNRHRYFDNNCVVNGFVPGGWNQMDAVLSRGPPLGTEQCSPGDGRIRRGSEGDQEGTVAPPSPNYSKQMFALYSPPKDRKSTIWNSDHHIRMLHEFLCIYYINYHLFT